MRKIRVLIVDDAVAVRRLVSEAIAADPALEVAGTAPSGRLALAKIPQVNPDIVTLDVEMPEMDGLQTLSAIRGRHPDLPVIMFSTMTRRGAEATLDALLMGARDYVNKPTGFTSTTAAMAIVRDELIPRIKAFCANIAGIEPPAAAKRSSAGAAPPEERAIDVVTIGVSTGGPNALAALLPRLPADIPVPILVVQHMPAIFTELLARRLSQQCALRVSEAVAGQAPERGQVLIAPGDFHMVVERSGGSARIRTHQGPQENSCRPAVDVLFRSAAETYGRGVLAVVLTGMGQDGLKGCERIRQEGGRILVQDEATSVVWGMPGFVARAGLADAVLPIEGIAEEITRRAQRGRLLSTQGSGVRGGSASPVGTGCP
jgi:two-component system chemotaxis response regulator CheB